MLELEKVREAIQRLDEKDAKRLLLLVYAQLDIAVKGTGGNEYVICKRYSA